MWVEVERPGYFGKKRPEIVKRLDEKHGRGNWREMWVVDGRLVERSIAIRLYEDAYFIYLRKNPEILEELVSTASEVYDNAPSNVQSGLDYSIQETVAVHIQDIAIRRALLRLGRSFAGNKLIQVRSTSPDEIGKKLTPGVVPFHRAFIIKNPRLRGWWGEDTVEDFYQSNKVIAIRGERS